jgi:hypothetical protein
MHPLQLFMIQSTKQSTIILCFVVFCIWRCIFPSPYHSSSKRPRIFERGIRENIDLKLEIRQVPHVDAELFNQYIKAIFIPTDAANRELPGRANNPAILSCDNCASHCSEEILRELARNGILVLTYPPHTSRLSKSLMSFSLVD